MQTSLQKIIFTIIITLVTVFVYNSLFADVCVEIDNTKDALNEKDRKNAKIYIEATFSELGKKINTSCTEKYVVYHLMLGKTVTVVMSSPVETKKLKANSIESLPDAYTQLAKGFINSKKIGDLANTDRDSVTDRQASPKRVKADGLFYGRLGYGLVTDKFSFNHDCYYTGPSWGLGYRYELDNLAIDFSFINGISAKGGTDGKFMDAIRLQLHYFFDPMNPSSLYIGSGLGYGIINLNKDTTYAGYNGSGLTGTFTFGYEMLRSSTIRIFFQFDATVPMFRLKEETRNIYTPAFSLSMGIGFN